MINEKSIVQVLDRSVNLFGNKEAVYDGVQRLSYDELGHAVRHLAAALIKLGIGTGDKVIVCLPNCHEFVITYFALARIGAVLIPGNPDEQDKEWDRIILIPGVKAVFCSRIDEKTEILIRKKLLKNTGRIITVRFSKTGLITFDELLGIGKTVPLTGRCPVANEDIFAILYTSGSTGLPKGVMLTHGNFLYSAENVIHALQCNETDTFLVPVPFSHVFGLIPGMLSVIMSGGKMVLLEKYRADSVLSLIEQERITVHYGVPTMFILELNDPAAANTDFSSLRTGMIGGSPCPESVVKRIISEMGCNIIVSYGATETAGGVTYTALGDDIRIRASTVGRPAAGTELQIVDKNRLPVPPGTVGELACRGRGIAKGYYPAQENAIDDDGWYYTGDLARVNDAGYVQLVGRKKDMIIRGGLNIYPSEVEEVFYTHPHIADVSVVGIPDDVLGEAACAVIKLKPSGEQETTAAMKEFIQARVAKYKIPDHFLFIERFLLTRTGKKDKKALIKYCQSHLVTVNPRGVSPEGLQNCEPISGDSAQSLNDRGYSMNSRREVDKNMVDFSLSDEQQSIQKLAREFTATHIIPVARAWDEKGGFHEFILAEARKAGLNCMAVPKEYGGAGYDSVTQSLVAEEWGYGCAAFSTTLGGNGLSSYPIAIAGTGEQKKLYYGRLVAGGMGGFALTEPGAGSDAGACATTARLDGDEWVLNGTKCFATTCGYAAIMVVFASTDPGKGVKGLSAFIVESEREGVIVGAEEHKMGIRSSNTVELILKNVRIPKGHLLGKAGEGMKIAMKTLDMARPIVASAAVGIARRALDEAIKFAKEYLDVNGKPIGSHQAVAFKLADMATQVEAARQLVRNALRLKDAGVPYTKEAAMAKTFATDAAMRVSADAVELMGQHGYSHDAIVEKLMRDAKVTQIYEGTNQVQRIVISGILMNS